MKNIILFLCAMLCVAQEAQTQKKTDSLTLKLQPVTVTATRYPEQVMEIPYAVSIINERDMLAVKPFGFDDVVGKIPGVLAQSRAGGQDIRITIRGFGARGAGDRSNAGTSRGVRIMVDGFPETEPDGRTSFDMIETGFADNIEVIRSNASALWGNASGGIINLNTGSSFTSPFANIGFSSGSFGQRKALVKTGVALGDARVIFGFVNNRLDGYREHSKADRSMFSLTFLSRFAAQSELGVYLLGSHSFFQIPGPLSQSLFDMNPKQANPVYKARDERRDNRVGRIGVKFSHALNDVHEFSMMAYASPKFLQRSERNTFRDFNRYHIGGNLMYGNSYTFANGIKNKFVAGVDEAYQDGAILFYKLNAELGRDTVLSDNKREGANTFGAFAQNECIISEQLSFIAGLRYDKISYYAEKFSTNSKTFYQSLAAQEKHFEKVTPKAGITYRFSEDVSLYANIGGGVEVPAGNETDDLTKNLLNPLLEPITSVTYETGVKTILLESNTGIIDYASFDAAAYYITVTNDIIPYLEGKYYQTAGKSSRKGLELGGTLHTPHGLGLTGGLTLCSNTYDSYAIDSVIFSASKAGIRGVFDGKKIAGLPSIMFNFGMKYKPVFFENLTCELSMASTGKYFVDDANTLEVPSALVVNGMIMYEQVLPFGRNIGLRASLSANNLLNAKHAESAFINPVKYNGETGFLEPGLPRNLVFSINLLF